MIFFFFFQAEDGIRDFCLSRGLGDVYKRQRYTQAQAVTGCQSFDDQIYLAVADMHADPRHRAYIEARFDHILVDEFQKRMPPRPWSATYTPAPTTAARACCSTPAWRRTRPPRASSGSWCRACT